MSLSRGEGLCPGGGVSVQGRGSLSRGGGLCSGEGVSVRGVYVQGGDLCQRDPPYIKERAVCILLEYILVVESFSVIPVTDFDENPCI